MYNIYRVISSASTTTATSIAENARMTTEDMEMKQRQSRISKRRTGRFRKPREVSTLCSGDIGMVAFFTTGANIHSRYATIEQQTQRRMELEEEMERLWLGEWEEMLLDLQKALNVRKEELKTGQEAARQQLDGPPPGYCVPQAGEGEEEEVKRTSMNEGENGGFENGRGLH